MRENDEYAAFARRVLRAYARRVADGDVEALTLMLGLAAEIDTAISQAVKGLRDFGYSWAEIGSRLGITRQAAQQRWGRTVVTAATAALGPEPITGLGIGGDRRRHRDHLLGRLPRLGTPARHLGHCSHPIRLRGRIDAIDLATGETAPVYDTAAEHGGVLHVACGNRREAVCPACSAVYKRDARQLVRAGLAGGKGIPETIAGAPVRVRHPHRPVVRPGPRPPDARQDRPALPTPPRRKTRRCPHGRDISCPTRHVEEDPRLGQPMCGDCYDYDAAVLFNAYAGDLWRRFITYLPRHLARRRASPRRSCAPWSASGTSRSPSTRHAASSTSTPSSAWTPPARTTSPRPPGITADMLCDAIGQAAAAVRSPPSSAKPARHARLRRRRPTPGPSAATTIAATGQPLDRQAVANYIAKYATKTLTAPGVPDQRLRHLADIEHLRCSAHYRRMITTAWQLGGKRQTGDPRFRQWAHMLGYGGHFLTKSRRYSVTFGQLRTARTDHRRRRRHPGGERDPWGRPLDETDVLVLRTWTYAGTGYTATPDAELAVASAARAREHHDQAAAIGG